MLNFAPDVNVTLRILLAIPTSIVIRQRSFSNLKLRTFSFHYHTKLSQWFVLILMIEHELADQINLRVNKNLQKIRVCRTKRENEFFVILVQLILLLVLIGNKVFLFDCIIIHLYIFVSLLQLSPSLGHHSPQLFSSHSPY